jgi:hypothetical protein
LSATASDQPLETGEDSFDCTATSTLLRSLGALVWASHVLAFLAIAIFTWYPLLPWAAVLYFGVRVRLDADLLQILARDPGRAPGRLDDWLARTGLRSNKVHRSLSARCQGSRRLAFYLLCAFLLQAAATGVALFGRL